MSDGISVRVFDSKHDPCDRVDSGQGSGDRVIGLCGEETEGSKIIRGKTVGFNKASINKSTGSDSLAKTIPRFCSLESGRSSIFSLVLGVSKSGADLILFGRCPKACSEKRRATWETL